VKKLTHFNIARLSIENISQPEKVTIDRIIYKWAFYLGTILPDLSITQFLHPHYYEKSSDYVFQSLCRIEGKDVKNIADAIRLGEMVHYLSDFCCFAHKDGCIGKISEHLNYERSIHKYLLENYPILQQTISKEMPTYERSAEILEQIKQKLVDYSEMAPCFERDIIKSVEILSIVYSGILQKQTINTSEAIQYQMCNQVMDRHLIC